MRVQSFMLGKFTTKLTLTVLSVYEGEKYADTALSLFSGAPATANLDWLVFRELSAAKKEAEYKLERYEWEKENYPEDIPRGLSFIAQDKELYKMQIRRKIEKEFGGKLTGHDIEVYSAKDFSIHLMGFYGVPWLRFYTKEKIKAVSFDFQNLFGTQIKSENKLRSDQNGYYGITLEEKDGWTVSTMHFWGDCELASTTSAFVEVEYESGRKQKAVLNRRELEKVKRFGELMIGAFDMK